MTQRVTNYCQVCNKPNAQIRFNGLACNSCRVFFSRYADEPPQESCRYENNCTIGWSLYQRYNTRSVVFSWTEQVELLRKQLNLNLAVGRRARSRHSKKYPANVIDKTFVNRQMVHFHSYIMSPSPIVGSETLERMIMCYRYFNQINRIPLNINISLSEVIANPVACVAQHMPYFEKIESELEHLSMKSNSWQTFFRMTVSFIEFLYSTQLFNTIPIGDRESIVQSNFFFCPIWNQLEDRLTKKAENDGKNVKTLEKHDSRFSQVDDANDWLYEMAARLHNELNINEIEFMYLKLISFFNPPVGLSFEGHRQTIFVKEALVFQLSQHISTTHPNLSCPDQLCRLSMLLKLIRQAKEVVDVMRNCCLVDTILNQPETAENLAFDMLVRVY